MATDHAGGLVGREAEWRVVEGLLAGASQGGGALVLRGEPGIGKSALLTHAAQSAVGRGMRVLSCAGVQSEAHIPFAGLHQLLHPVLDRGAALPELQRGSLLGAFGLMTTEPPELFAVGLAVLSLLGDIGADEPVVVLADDLQWLDTASCEVLAFVGRRLGSDPVVLLAAARDGSSDPLQRGTPALPLGRLRPGDARALLDRHAGALPEPVRERLLFEAAGNPLALVELPRSSAPSEDPSGWQPLNERLVRVFASRLTDLPVATRTVLLVAALHEVGDLSTILSASRLLDPALNVADLRPAERARVVEPDPVSIRFQHPLLRAAVRQEATAHERASGHLALAASLESLPEQRTWHLVAAADGPDEALAAELESLGERYARRGALHAAAAALDRAGGLSVTSADRGRRSLRSAGLALQVGDSALVSRVLRETQLVDLRPDDADRRLLLQIASAPPEPGDEAGVLRLIDSARQLRERGQHDAALEVLMVAALAEAVANREDTTGARIVDLLSRVRVPDADPRRLFILAYASPLRSAAEVAPRIAERTSGPSGDPGQTGMIAAAAISLGSFDLALPHLDAGIHGLRRTGRLSQLTQILLLRAFALLYAGRWDEALADAGEATRLGEETQQPIYEHASHVVEAVVLGLRGQAGRAAELLTAAERVGMRHGAASLLNVVQFGRGLLALAEAEHGLAHAHLLRMFEPGDPAYHRNNGCWMVSYLAEAAVRSGNVERGREVLRRVELLAAGSPSSLVQVSVRHARAVLADDEDAQDRYREARTADLDRWSLDRARLDLNEGMWLRRRRRVSESREPLRRARDAFDSLGAVGWADQSRMELRATGETSGKRLSRVLEGLTAQELQIAMMAADGLSNRDIAARLYLSHRTVGSHLHKIYPKLGITSRSSLGTSLAGSA